MSNFKSMLILSRSSSGLGPNCVVVAIEFCRDGCGVPDREGCADIELRALTEGGVELGRVVISNGGKGLPFARGSISSRLTGIPNAIRC